MPRPSLPLDGPWDLIVDPDGTLTPATLAAAPARTTRVPGPWQAQHDDLRDYTGVAWYRRAFDAPPPGPRAFVCFGAVEYHAAVWVNGALAGQHEGGYLPFEFDITDLLRPGANEVVVRVTDPGPDSSRTPGLSFAETPHGKQSWYGPIGGIWQSVRLERRAPLHLARLQITPDIEADRAHVEAFLSGPPPEPVELALRLTGPDGRASERRVALVPGEAAPAFTLDVPDPLLWDIGRPNLYTLEAALLGPDGAETDTLSATFGMRSVAASPEGRLLLNGRPIYLRGALDQDYYPELIYTPFDDEQLDRQFAMAREMGLNCLRTHIKITDPRYYAAADRAGLLIWTELPNLGRLTEDSKRRGAELLRGMVERDWNHPSIIIWTIINEGWGVDLTHNPEHRAWLADAYVLLKARDPHRLVVGNSPCKGNFHVVSDLEDFHNYYAMPDHYDEWRAWVESFAGRASWSYAHELPDYDAIRLYGKDPWGDRERTPSPEARRGGAEPLLVSEFGNWGLPDLRPLYAAYGGEPWWFETGFDWGVGVVYPHGVERRFAAYYLHKVFGDYAGLAAASQRLQFAALKEQIEQMRRHASIVGYVITEFTDVHWECNGLLDMARNPKAFYGELAALNADDALVPEWERTVYRAGEQVRLPVALSHYSELDLRGARLIWDVDVFPELGGELPALGEPARYGVSAAGVVAFAPPDVERPTRAWVRLLLRDGAGAVAASSYQELWIFPRAVAWPDVAIHTPDAGLAAELGALGLRLAPDLAAAGVVVTETLTHELRRHAQSGGRVLLLADSEDAIQSSLGGVKVVTREDGPWEGDWASSLSWVRRDTLFGDLPTDGAVDFAFAGLTPDYVITKVPSRDYAERVHAGLFVGWIHQVAALVADRPVGRGRVLICTFRLRQALAANPLAQELLRAMIGGLARAS